MTGGRTCIRTVADLGLIVLFAGLISLPGLRNLTGPVQEPEGWEKRMPAPRPPFRLSRGVLLDFPGKFEAYYNDHFGLRNSLIHWLNRAKVLWLHISCAPHVILGRQGWLFYTVDPVGSDYRTVRPFQEEELEHWRGLLENRRDWLARRGIPYLLVVAPDKQSIYPEMLPPSMQPRAREPSRLDQLIAHLNARSDFRLLDLRGRFRRAKSREPVYFRTDTHWNELGALLAYQQTLEPLAARFPALKPLPRSAFKEVLERSPGGDLAVMLGVADRVAEENPVLVPRQPRQAREVPPDWEAPLPPTWPTRPVVMERPDRRLPRAVIFRDSFGTSLIPFFSEHFSRVCYLWKYDFDFQAVARERPDVVIQEIVERTLQLAYPSS